MQSTSLERTHAQSPQRALVLGVHGRAPFAVECLGEFIVVVKSTNNSKHKTKQIERFSLTHAMLLRERVFWEREREREREGGGGGVGGIFCGIYVASVFR